MNTKTIATTFAVLFGAAGCSLTEDTGTTLPRTSASAPTTSEAASRPADPAPAAVDPRDGGFDVGFGEFAITLEAEEIRPGQVTFVVRNGGALVHGIEMEIDGGDSSGHGSGDGFKLKGRVFGPEETLRFPITWPPASTRSSASSPSATTWGCAPSWSSGQARRSCARSRPPRMPSRSPTSRSRRRRGRSWSGPR